MKMIMLALLLVVVAIPFFILADRPEAVCADNTTIGIGFSENISIGDITVSVGDNLTQAMQEAMTAAMVAMIEANNDHMDTMLASIVGFIVCILISFWAIWKENYFIYLLGVPVNLIFGLFFASAQTVGSVNWVVGVIIAVIGTYFLFHVAWRSWQIRRARRLL